MAATVAIAGAGVAGSYLYGLLRRSGVPADLYDTGPGTTCGLTPCAWGTSRGFAELVAAAGLDPDAYVLRRLSHLVADGVRLRVEVLTFDKPRLVADLRGGGSVRPGTPDPARYRRVIDATGTARALLPPVADDLVLRCVQGRVRTAAQWTNRIELGGIGYAWCFPLEDGSYHVGCGSLLDDPAARLRSLGWLDGAAAGDAGEVRCRCGGRIRLTGPHGARPFVVRRGQGEVWGVGEAVGCVAPLAGDGVVPSMRSAHLLWKHWEDPHGYARALLEEFGWMREERRVLDKLRANRRLSLADANVLVRNSRRMGMEIGVTQALRLIRRIR
ncbi:MAG: NAD(P)/FAD-dependent oxidoreductase [Deferrisomatales bacterium]